jgi:hypothetical protein
MFFREGRIRDASTNESLETNFGRGGMKKLMEDKLGKTSFVHDRGAETYHIEARLSSVEASSKTSCEIIFRGV